MELTSIYGLFDRQAPELVWYVGKADNIKKRMKQHVTGTSGCNKSVRDWVKTVRKLGIKVLEEVDATRWEKGKRPDPTVLTIEQGLLGGVGGCHGEFRREIPGQ